MEDTIGTNNRKIYNLDINLRFLTNTTTRTPLTHIKDKQHTTHPYPTEHTVHSFICQGIMHACTIRPLNQKQLPNIFGLTQLISVA
jgi:hypothetical protein